MTTQTYSAKEFRRALDGFKGRTSVDWKDVALPVEAALRIAARVMTPGVLERAIRVALLGPENANLEPDEYEHHSVDLD